MFLKKSIFKQLIPMVLWVLVVCNLSSCNLKKNYPPQTQLVLGTVCTINLFENGSSEKYNSLFKELKSIENRMSLHVKDSEIVSINNNAGKKWVSVSEDTFFVLSQGKAYGKKTSGAFDPTIGPLVKLWNVTGNESFGGKQRVPSLEDIARAKNLVNYEKLLLNAEEKKVFLTEEGMSIDVGAIAKGYACDVLVQKIRDFNIEKATIDLGGNIYVIGKKNNKEFWQIGIRTPSFSEKGTVISIPLSDNALVTSGMYERYFEENGKIYHHILDKKTGWPVNNDILSVSIVNESSMIADILSTACFVLGEKKALELLERENVQGVIINKSQEINPTNELRGQISLLDVNFKL